MHSLSQRPIAAIVVANPRICRRTKVSGDLCWGRPYNPASALDLRHQLP